MYDPARWPPRSAANCPRIEITLRGCFFVHTSPTDRRLSRAGRKTLSGCNGMTPDRIRGDGGAGKAVTHASQIGACLRDAVPQAKRRRQGTACWQSAPCAPARPERLLWPSLRVSWMTPWPMAFAPWRASLPASGLMVRVRLDQATMRTSTPLARARRIMSRVPLPPGKAMTRSGFPMSIIF